MTRPSGLLSRGRWVWLITLAVLCGLAVGVVVLFGIVAHIARATTTLAGGLGIPERVLAAYRNAETQTPVLAAGCEVSWTVTAGIWKITANHTNLAGHTLSSDGRVTPPLTHPPSDDSTEERLGPGGIPASVWSEIGVDGGKDGRVDPQQVDDAALTAAIYLCHLTPGGVLDDAGLSVALAGYNPQPGWAERVMAWINYYRSLAGHDLGGLGGTYVLPVPAGSVTVEMLTRPHHDYPAADLPLPVGTPIYAAHGGVVVAIPMPCGEVSRCRCGLGVRIAGDDGHTYSYCHGHQLTPGIHTGTRVTAGTSIMLSGNSGNSAAPHLHLQIRTPTGQLICPQPLLEAWYHNLHAPPSLAPTAGCTY